MAKVIRNESGITKIWAGQEVLNGASYTIEDNEIGTWANNDDVLASIVALDLVVSNGTSDFTSPTLAINYLKDISEMDSSGRRIIKTAAALKGATYLANFCRITTCVSVVSNKWDGTAGDYSINFYDINGDEVLSNDINCTKTIVNFAPTHDYEIMAGKTHVAEKAAVDVTMDVIGGCTDLKHLPGTVVEMVRGVNFKYVQSSLLSDGRASKYMTYTTAGIPYPTNKLQFILTHPAGHQYSLLVAVEMFR